MVVVEISGMACVSDRMGRGRVDVGVGGAEDVLLFHFFKLLVEDVGDVLWGCLWDIDVNQECAGGGSVVRVDSCEVNVVDELRCVV